MIPSRRPADQHQDMSSTTALGQIAPCFIVNNLADAIDFYTQSLGFDVQFSTPDESPFFAIVGRHNVSIHLKAVAESVAPVPNNGRHEFAPFDAFIWVGDPDALYTEFKSRGVSFRDELSHRDDGVKGFVVEDADGYALFFGRPTE